MKTAPETINDPTFGPCTRVRSLIAVRWATPQTGQEVAAKASRASLNVADESQATEKRGGTANRRRNPADLVVNHSELLTWFSARREISATAISKIQGDSDIAWTAPVYRSKQSEDGPRSYFAITPTVIVLSEAALAAAGGVSAVDPAATIDRTRSALLKGYVVVDLPDQNAIAVAARLQKMDALQGIPNAISFEHTPYISPTCCGCGCGGEATAKRECSPESAPFIPNDPLFPNEWGLQRINAPRAWTTSKGDPNVVIAVLDQGVDLAHPDINLWPVSYSTITHTNNGGPVGNHGTACAGIIGGRINNSLGVTGLAGEARVMAIATNFADVEVAEGLTYAADNGARVVSMSFGVYPSWGIWNFAIIQSSLQYCQQKNVVLCAASGNENIPQSRFPGSDPTTICVGGSNRADVRKSIGDTSSESWWGACYGADLDVVAPCLEIPTTDRLGAAGYTPTDYDLFFNGTSSATPHVAALCGLILSVDGDLTSGDVRRIVSETTDKINTGGYVYANTAGKPYGTWTNEVGYGRINAERALLAACSIDECRTSGPCAVTLPKPEACCVSPCDPPWRPEAQCMVWYEDKYFRVPITRDKQPAATTTLTNNYIEFRVTYEHRMCLLGKQHGPLVFTTTLLPGETIRLYHSDRYRRITTAQQRFSVQSTFMQFLSLVHQARVTNSLDSLNRKLSGSSSSGSSSEGGGFFFGLFGGGGSSESSSSSFASSESELATHFASDLFQQSIFQSSQLTQIERSVVVSTFEEKDVQDITVRTLHNANECRAVTYFVRQIVELYQVSTRVVDVSYRIVASNVPDLWHSIQDLGWLPAPIRNEIQQIIPLLPRVGDVVTAPRPLSLPTDGTVYDPELAHCCSCEPERAAAIAIRLEKEKAEALKACLEAQELEIEIQRRRLLLQKGELAPFESAAPPPAPAPAG